MADFLKSFSSNIFKKIFISYNFLKFLKYYILLLLQHKKTESYLCLIL